MFQSDPFPPARTQLLKFLELSKTMPPVEDKSSKTIVFGGIGDLTVYLNHSSRLMDVTE